MTGALPRRCVGGGRLFVAHGAEYVQQRHEQVVERDVQSHGGADVVGLAAVDDGARLPEDGRTGKEHESAGDGDGEGRQVEEQAEHDRAHQHEEAHHQEPGEEAEIPAGDHGIGGEADESRGGGAQRRGDQVWPVCQAQVGIQNGACGEAQEAREQECENDPQRGVGGLVYRVEQPEEADNRDQETRIGRVHRDRHHRGRGAERQGHAQQQIGVAQDVIDLDGGGSAGAGGNQVRLRHFGASKVDVSRVI